MYGSLPTEVVISKNGFTSLPGFITFANALPLLELIPEPVSISETKPINPVTTEKEPVPSITETKPTEKEPVGPIKNKIKQVKFKKTTEADKFKDERMNAAYNGLTSLGFTEDNVLKFLNRIDLEADDTTENIIQTGIKHLSKNK